ncbi:hypothetical protein [Pararhizobium gei]|uniref:hypothetical protein n=1 Tax=Pararhizobium gei TaxID=1395951 RepID=UPI0023DC1FC3|nr:hypothetical protein [Rhizobium gei]
MIKSPHPALDLSFMCPRKVGCGMIYWNVETTGSYTEDCKLGGQYGTEFLTYIGRHPTNGNATLLGCIVADMDGHPATGLKIGFMAEVNRYAMGLARIIHGPGSIAENLASAAGGEA